MGPIDDLYWIRDNMDIEMLARRIVAKPGGIPFDRDTDALEYLRGVRAKFVDMDEFPLIDIIARGKMSFLVYFVGDIHGDLDTCKKIMNRFLKWRSGRSLKAKGMGVKLVFLGDYIDRAPKEIRNGGALTVLYLLSAKYLYPDDIILLRGNHEAIDLLTFAPYELPMEIHDLFGADLSEEIHNEMVSIFTLLPLFVRTSNGVIASHAAFPRNRNVPVDRIDRSDAESILQTIWGDPKQTETYRGDISKRANFDEDDLRSFLEDVGASVLLRGHAHKTLGYSMYGDRMFTVFTSRRYKKRGNQGILLVRALVHKDKRIGSAQDLNIKEITDGKLIDRSIERL